MQNDIIGTPKPAQQATKNESKDFVVQSPEKASSDLQKGLPTSYTQGIASESKEKSYMRSNGSVVNMLPSTQDLPQSKGTESTLFPCRKQGLETKRAMNQSSIFAKQVSKP